MNTKLVLALALTLAAQLAGAQSAVAEPGNKPAGQSDGVLETAGEVFLKGSIDGKRMFMVLGMKDAAEVTKEIAKWAVNGEDLRDLADSTWNKKHKHDVVDRLNQGLDFSKSIAPEILKQPWKSLQEIPGSYKVNFENAREALHGAKNPTVGVLKYSGWAIWANIEGAYYLVIEAPVVFAAITVATVAAAPTMLVVQAFVSGWYAGKIIVNIALGAIAIAGVQTYAVISASTATALTLVAAGGIAVFKAGKWVVHDLPRGISHPVQVERKLDISYDKQQAVAAVIDVWLKKNAQDNGISAVTSEIEKYKSKFILTTKSSVDGREIVLGKIMLTTRKAKLKLTAEISREYFKDRRAAQPEIRRKDLKKTIGAELVELLEKIQAELDAGTDSENVLPIAG